MSSVVNPFTGRWIMEPKTQNVWGNQHATWFTLMGIGGGLYINRLLFGMELGRFWGMTWADILSLVLIGVGGLILIADLGRPFRLLRALLNPRTSWISIGAIADFTFMGLAGLWTLADLSIEGGVNLSALPWHGDSGLGMVFQVVAALAAIVVIVYPGLVLIGVGGLILILDLGRPLRLLRALLNPRTSWISIGAIADFTFMGLAGLWTLADLSIEGGINLTALPWHGDSGLGMVFQVIAALAAIVVIVYPGLVLASSPSIPFWNSGLVPMQFLVNGFASGFGIALIYSAVVQMDGAGEDLGFWLGAAAILLAASLALQIFHVLNGQYTHTAGKVAVRRLLSGNLQLAYLGGVMLVGLIVPLALIAYALVAETNVTTAAAAAGVLIVVGNWLSKHTVIRAGTYAPLF